MGDNNCVPGKDIFFGKGGRGGICRIFRVILANFLKLIGRFLRGKMAKKLLLA